MMQRPVIDSYFEKLGIQVVYNCLGHNEDLIYSFVSDYGHFLNSFSTQSNHIKPSLYQNIYNIKYRIKSTGFERVSNLDRDFRNNIRNFITKPQYSPLLLIEKEEISNFGNYKERLNQFTSNIKNPLLYYSGGMDSEIVALSFLEKHKSFKMVVFEWIDNRENIINLYDLQRAYSFCREHGIIPIIKQINIETLWESTEFKNLAIDIQIASPQLVTHAYSILLMNQELPNVTHVFGGEVRFKNYLLDNGNTANLVFLDKLLPGYNNQTYVADSYLTCDNSQLQLVYDRDDGIYYIIKTEMGVTSTLDTGNWLDIINVSPSTQFERRITNVVTYPTIGSNAGTVFPAGPYPSAWQTITNPPLNMFLMCELYQINAGTGQYLESDAIFDIEVRVVGQSAPVQSSNIRFNCLASCQS